MTGVTTILNSRNQNPAVTILGIDPGLVRTGYGLISCGTNLRVIDAGVINLESKTPIAERLVELERELDSIFSEHEASSPIQVCAVEQLYAHYGHPRTAILMGHARGVILLVAQRRGVRLVELSANRVKQSLTGHGHASKSQMQHGVMTTFGLAAIPEPPDVADALAIALCAYRDALPGGSTSRQSPARQSTARQSTARQSTARQLGASRRKSPPT